MTKTIIFAIDSLDSILIEKFKSDLPNIEKLKKRGKQIPIEGVFPPDSPTSWASIYTGKNPAEHGVLHFIDPLARITTLGLKELDPSSIKGGTFWDKLSIAGKRVCLFNALITFPPWKVNGVMIGRATTQKKFKVFPPDLNLDISSLFYPKHVYEFPNKTLAIDYFKEAIINEANFCKDLYEKEEWDLFFFYSSYLDTIQHEFWDYYDDRDTNYKKNHKFENTIKNFYILIDRIIGDFLEIIREKTTVIILSDHGHDMRPPMLVNINEILRREGFLIEKTGIHISIIENMKKRMIQIISKFHLAKYAQWSLRKFPSGKNVFTSPVSIDLKESIAVLSDLSGIKAYTYGGIIITRKLDNYEKIREEIIRILSLITTSDETPVFKWIKRREKLYSGIFQYKFPDIVFRLKDGYGAGWKVGKNSHLFEKSESHSLFPGSHRGETPVFIISPSHHQSIDLSSIKSLIDISSVVFKIVSK